MREHNEDWEKQRNSVVIEIVGLSKIFIQEIEYLVLLSKLEGLKVQVDLDFQIYRKTVFEVINLIQEFKNAKI